MSSGSPGVDDNFFFSGGDSILAAQIVARVRDTLSVDVSLLSFFDSPTVAGFARVVDEAMNAAAAPAEMLT
jgi:nonribosomal peptide synthetase DhbF